MDNQCWNHLKKVSIMSNNKTKKGKSTVRTFLLTESLLRSNKIQKKIKTIKCFIWMGY